jgi:hypothetical protein
MRDYLVGFENALVRGSGEAIGRVISSLFPVLGLLGRTGSPVFLQLIRRVTE